MQSQHTSLQESLAIVEDIQLIENFSSNHSLTLVPDNQAEIFIPLKNDVVVKSIGSIRTTSLTKKSGYFLMPRRRGLTISLPDNEKCLVLKINPIYANNIAKELEELQSGIFRMDINNTDIQSLLSAEKIRDSYNANETLQNILYDISYLFHEYNTTIVESIEYIKLTKGTTSIKDIYSTLDISKSKLEQLFNREIGLTPKEFCKIEKMNQFINLYYQEESSSLTELTYRCGYYDQSHLIKDFRYFLDTSPRKFLAKSL